MRAPLLWLSGLALTGALSARAADVTVVFNEVMYHPATNEPAFEWVELHNQLAVDIDISGWRLAGGADFTFAEGTTVAGGGYLVVALDPASLAAAHGITNVVGPFAGRLDNAGEAIELRNNNSRRMDKMAYNDKGDWPVAPDGAGPSLAKLDEAGASGDAENWRASVQQGGSPGQPNFPSGTNREYLAISFDSPWSYTTVEPTGGWQSAAFHSAGWTAGTGIFAAGTAGWCPADRAVIPTLFSTGVGHDGVALAPGQPDPHYALVESAQSSNPPPPAVPATVMQPHPAWLANDAASRWIGVASNGAANVAVGLYRFATAFDLSGFDATAAVVTVRVAVDNNLTNVVLNGVSNGLSHTGFSALSGALVVSNGFAAGSNTLEFLAVNGASSPNPGGFRALVGGVAPRFLPTNTVLAVPGTTHYFRTAFVVTGDVSAASLRLRAVVDDGAIFSLNGTELLRLHLPGAVSNATPATTNIGNAGLGGPFLLPGAALVAGTNILAVELHPAAGGGSDAMFGAELAVIVSNSPLPRLPTLAFNEMPDVTNATFWAEIVNWGPAAVPMTNFVFKRFGLPDQEYIIPPTNLAPGAFLVITREQLGWGADPGDQLVLYTPGKSNVVDAMVAKRYDRARWPDGTGPWRHPAALTPGASNQIPPAPAVVINEILYHPRDPQGPATDPQEQWIELLNRGTNPVDLTGWRIEQDGEPLYDFAPGRTLAAGGYLVVARDAAWLAAKYPSADIVGNFSNRLSKKGARLELFDGTHYPDYAWGNPVAAVPYRDAHPWPVYADGLGASLELRDPRADAARPAAWAASDDRALASWQTITYMGTATVETASSPTLWREFVLGLLDAGEVLLDDISVVESPTGTARQVIQNGDFEQGVSAWRCLGTHQGGEVIAEPGQPGNHVLRLVSDGGTEHMHNHVETTLTNNLPVTNGLVYEVSFRARWIAGCNRLHTRLYFNRLARVHELDAPAAGGTPGAPNSGGPTNAGPTFSALRHWPVVPTNGQAVAVSVAASDPDHLASAVLWYAVDGGPWQEVPMAAAPDGGRFLAGIPGQPAGSRVQFYIAATDGQGVIACHPPAGPASRALYVVADATPILPALRTVRLVMTDDDASWLHAATNVMSNAWRPCTVVVDERHAVYDARVHLQGSQRGRDDAARVGFTVRYPSDQRFRGALEGFTIDRSGGYSGRGGDQDELLLKHIINRAGRLPGMHDDLCQFLAPRPQDNGAGLMILAKYSDAFLDGQYADGGDGGLFKLELIYYPTSTVVPGDPQSAKRPQPDVVLGTDIKDLGDDHEQYRWVYLAENHVARNDYSQMVALARAFSLTGALFDAEMAARLEADEWMRNVALLGLIGNNDIYTYGLSHNQMLYFRPADGRALALPWDLDSAFTQSTNATFPGTGSPNTTKLINRPQNLHAYYEHLHDLAEFTGDAAYNARWASNYAGRVGQNWQGAVTWLAQRAQWVRGRLALATPFAVTNHGGAGFAVSNAFVTIGGTAPVNVRFILVNGISYPVTWTSATNWMVTVPLTDYANAFTLAAADLRGGALSNGTASITITNFGLPAPRPLVINEWMADNAGPGGHPDPADGLFQDWIELFNPNSNSAVDLQGWFLTDDLAAPTKWQVPTTTVVAPLSFLLVWADEDAAQNGGTNGEWHASFKLGAGGEQIGLFNAATVLQSAVTFGPQQPNMSEGVYPDGDTNRYVMPNWTPRAPNVPGALPAPGFIAAQPGPGGGLGVATLPGRLYHIEFNDTFPSDTWQSLLWQRADAAALNITNSAASPFRVYRSALVP